MITLEMSIDMKQLVLVTQEKITEICEKLKVHAVPLVDAFGIPDKILGSSIGASDGEIYQRIYSSWLSTPDVFSPPSWAANYLSKGKNHAKL